jgi:hypothetical protein
MEIKNQTLRNLSYLPCGCVKEKKTEKNYGNASVIGQKTPNLNK